MKEENNLNSMTCPVFCGKEKCDLICIKIRIRAVFAASRWFAKNEILSDFEFYELAENNDEARYFSRILSASEVETFIERNWKE